MTTKTMSACEEVYRYLEEHPELRVISTPILRDHLSWLGTGAISGALTVFRNEERLAPLRKIGNTIYYKKTRVFKKKRKFHVVTTKASFNRRTGYTHENRLTMSSERAFDKKEALTRLSEISEVLSDFAEEVDALREELEGRLVI